MKIKYLFILVVTVAILWLGNRKVNFVQAAVGKVYVPALVAINPKGTVLQSRVGVPAGYKRPDFSTNSVGNYLRELPVKPHGATVLLFNGQEKGRQDVQAAIINLEIGNKDLQQCADAVMRLRAEYLYKQKRYDAIHFNFTSGDQADFTKYAAGYRAVIAGNKVKWVKKAAPSYSYKTFRDYLNLVFTYAGTASLTQELIPVKNVTQLQPGDVFIQGGFPGHAVMVMDVAVHEKTGKKIFLLAQSYMPAQDIHILRNPKNHELSPWYSTDFGSELKTPEWDFKPTDLKKFATW